MDLVGRYRIESQIGEGAMADVYRAYDPGIGRTIAIKILKQEFCQNPEVVERFIREAKTAGALSHPNIVTIHDVGEVDGYPYIAMELLDGISLDDVIRERGRLSLRAAARIGHQLARALQYAHDAGVVHRDIKPSNIMLCDGGRTAKLLDFGIARMAEADRVRAELTALRTQVGQVLGTPRYMSPEQAMGLDIDHRSDLFSFGVVLYEMLTGKAPFTGTSMATIAIQITQQKPEPINATVPDCPRGMQFIVEKLLAKQPERRFEGGRALASALSRELEALVSESPMRRRGLSLPVRLTIMMALVTTIALGLSIGMVLKRQYATMEQMALTSGASIAAFVANNVSLRAVDNAGLPPEQQDWLPVQAFIAAASTDPNVQQITMVDAFGTIRGSSNPDLVGKRYVPTAGEPMVALNDQQRVTSTLAKGDRDGFRFVHTIRYANRPFGKIDLVVGKAELKAAAARSRDMLVGLACLILMCVMGVSVAIAQLLAMPIRRLKEALADATEGKYDFRISHHRRDEFGDLFDGFNALVASLEIREQAGVLGDQAKPVEALPVLEADPAAVTPRRRRIGRGQ